MFDWNFSPTHTSSEPFSQIPVRASTKFYLRFTLDMGRSHGFGSTACNLRPVKTRFPCGFAAEQLNLATHRNSLARSTKSTRSLSLSLLVGTRFQVLFHSPPGVLFTFPSRYCSLSVIQEYLALGGGPPMFPQGYTCPVVLARYIYYHIHFAYGTVTPCGSPSHAIRLQM